MTDQQAADQLGRAASIAFARFWYAECQKIAEQIDDPAARWEIMVRALHRVGRLDS